MSATMARGKDFDMADFKVRTFTNRNGNEFTTEPHYAHFNDKFNASRTMVYMVLYHHKHRLGKSTGLTLSEIVSQAGNCLSYAYIKTRLAKWVSWKFIERKLSERAGRACYEYRIAERGETFIRERVPQEWLQRYASRIREAKSRSND